MADRDADLAIIIGAIADEKSAKEAAQRITNTTLKSLKGGYIEIPTAISTKFDETKSSEKLRKAQQDFINQWKKMSSEGFSSSEEDLKKFVDSFVRFRRLMGKESKGKDKFEQDIAIRDIGLVNVVKQYKSYKKALKLKIKELTTPIDVKDTKIKPVKDTSKKKEKGVSGVTKKLDYNSSSAFDSPRPGTSKTLFDSDRGGAYSSSYLRQNLLRSKGANGAVTSRIDPQAVAKAFSEMEQKKEHKLYKSPEETAKEISGLLLKQLPKIIKQIETGEDKKGTKEKVSVDDFVDTFNTIFKLNAGVGSQTIATATHMVDAALAPYFNTKGYIGVGDGTDKTEGTKDDNVETALKALLDSIKQKENEMLTQLNYIDDAVKPMKTYSSYLDKVVKGAVDLTKSTKDTADKIEAQTTYDLIEHSAERVADAKEVKSDRVLIDAIKADAATGFNRDDKADKITNLVMNIKNALTKRVITAESSDVTSPWKTIIPASQSVLNTLKNITGTSTEKKEKKDVTNKKESIPENQAVVPRSTISTSVVNPGSVITKIKDLFAELTGVTANYKTILSKTSEEQDALMAERISTYGLDRNATDTGDKARMARNIALWRNQDKYNELFGNLKLTEGIKVDTEAVTHALSKVLAGKEMFNAQTGGTLRNLFGSMTGYIGMPSLEKSRAQADALNEVMAKLRSAFQETVTKIENAESALTGMQKRGDLVLGENGEVLKGSAETKALVTDLEKWKLTMTSILADAAHVDQIVDASGGKVNKIVKRLGFTSPILRDNNEILRNINAGLDKNGKALKFQSRTAEVLNYSFQLMARHIGQMWKNLILQLNPLTQIKKAFNEFASYNTKWQRTMNVIKYNIHAILEPFMDKVAQFLVNCIGFVDIISMKVQEAFGSIPISLFDQAAADSQKIKEELEAASNVSAGFDELHDIGSDNSGANDLLGDIYTPNLPESWKKLAEEIGDLFAGIITGDMGFAEVMATILDILVKGLALIAKTIWNWFKETAIGQYLTEHWTDILATILGIFLGWQLLKIAGSALFNALFGKLTLSSITGVFNKIGGWITTLLGASGFGQGIMLAFQSLFAGGKYSLIGTLGEMFTNSAAITQAGSWGSMIGFALVKGLVGVLSIALGGKMVTDAFDSAADKTSYNIGLEQSGGNKEDKKGIGGDVLKSAAGGAAIGFGIGQIVPVIGPLVGAAVGAVAGALVTSLAPAFEAVEVASRNANNEMQKIEYYEAAVQGATSQVEGFTELQSLMSEAVENQTNKIYTQGEQLGISTDRMNELVTAIQNGTYNTDMLSISEQGLSSSLDQLNVLQDKNRDATEKLTEAKKTLQKAEMDLAIAEDITAGNFELAAARVEVALASEVYSGEEAGKQMAMILKNTNDDMTTYLLDDMSPDLKENWTTYVSTTEQGKNDLKKLYAEMNEEQRKAFSKSYENEASESMKKAIDAMQEELNDTTFDWSHPFKSLGSLFTGNWSWKAKYASFDVGTNYVPNDGFAYIHKGEAIIPKDENVFAKQGKAWQGQELTNTRVLAAITSLENTMKQGITVNGQFTQRGSDLVAVVNKTKSQAGADLLSNAAYAR